MKITELNSPFIEVFWAPSPIQVPAQLTTTDTSDTSDRDYFVTDKDVVRAEPVTFYTTSYYKLILMCLSGNKEFAVKFLSSLLRCFAITDFFFVYCF